jgi:hypothetical protein
MKVFLTSAYNSDTSNNSPAQWLKTKSISSTSLCTNDPNDADVIIFVESHPGCDPYFRKVFQSPLYRKYKKKCVLYHDADLSITPMPTISPSIELWQYNSKHKRSRHYIARSTENETVDNAEVNYKTNREYLYSFIGSKTHSIRNKIISMRHPSDVYIKDTTGLNAWEMDRDRKLKYELEFYRVSDESCFILCPRGLGPSSYRLFETMQLGRVPVIIADAWVEIPGIEWEEISIRINEDEINRIPEILDAKRKDAIEMGKNARKCWENFFSPEVSLERIANSAMKLVESSYSSIDAIGDYGQFLKSPWHLKNYFRYKKNSLKRTLKTRQRK